MEVGFLRKQITKSINCLSTMGYSRAVRRATAKDNVILHTIRTEPKAYRNEMCNCGSGKKYKHCCMG